MLATNPLEALQYLEQTILKTFPLSPRAHLLKATLLIHHKKMEESYEFCCKAILLDKSCALHGDAELIIQYIFQRHHAAILPQCNPPLLLSHPLQSLSFLRGSKASQKRRVKFLTTNWTCPSSTVPCVSSCCSTLWWHPVVTSFVASVWHGLWTTARTVRCAELFWFIFPTRTENERFKCISSSNCILPRNSRTERPRSRTNWKRWEPIFPSLSVPCCSLRSIVPCISLSPDIDWWFGGAWNRAPKSLAWWRTLTNLPDTPCTELWRRSKASSCCQTDDRW